jgi:HPt (histidine-containing phosphotransfer) domain-containing protein
LRDAVAQWIDKAPRKGPSKPPSADDTPLIDRAVIEELRSVMTANQFAGLVEMFVARAEQQAEAFPRWLAASATGDIAGEAHKLVSAAGALGARRVQKIAGRLENACREGGGASVPGMIEKLVRALTEASAELRRERVRAEVQASDKEVVAVG